MIDRYLMRFAAAETTYKIKHIAAVTHDDNHYKISFANL